MKAACEKKQLGNRNVYNIKIDGQAYWLNGLHKMEMYKKE
jgi:hypothetical protein